MMNFETVYPHYQQLVDRLHPNEQHNKNAAWAAFNGLVKSGVFDENRFAHRQCSCLSPQCYGCQRCCLMPHMLLEIDTSFEAVMHACPAALLSLCAVSDDNAMWECS